MTTQPTPEEIRRATFRAAFRGFDQASVGVYLDSLAARIEDLTEQRDRLAARLGEFADKDLRTEFEQVGREVATVLESAREAAETMRERASTDAARWRSEAVAEVEALTKAARSDAEAMRTDAWTTSTQMLEQVQTETDRLLRTAERDALAVMGEAEREAHRLVSSSRREAEDLVRTAKMEAEKLAADARAEHDEIIAAAHRQAEAAQERTRALEQRRDELMKEMESVRTALSSFEGELEVRRSGLGLSDPPELPHRAVILDESGAPHLEDWEEGHTVRVIRPTKAEEEEAKREAETAAADSASEVTDAEALAAEVALLRAAEAKERVPEPRADDDAGDDGAVDEAPAVVESVTDIPTVETRIAELAAPADSESAEATDSTGPEVPPGEEPAGADAAGSGPAKEENEVFELFRRLRRPSEAPGEEQAAVQPSEDESEPEPAATEAEKPDEVGSDSDVPVAKGASEDPFERRERLLLPLTNQALRSMKRTLTDAQNEALEQIRLTDGDWVPDAETIEVGFRDDLASLVSQATEAGREAAAEMGLKAGGVVADQPDLAEIGADLARALEAGLQHAGAGSRERSAAASRVFRGWRTDEAERRVRSVALASYHSVLRSAIERSDRDWKWVPAGRMCAACKAAAQAGDTIPPVHRDCNCTIEMA